MQEFPQSSNSPPSPPKKNIGRIHEEGRGGGKRKGDDNIPLNHSNAINDLNDKMCAHL